MSLQSALCLVPEYRERVWGGKHLKPHNDGKPVGEAWIVYERNRVASGPREGRTLEELSEEYGAKLLGRRVVRQTGNRFPLLIKLLDCAEWLSVQVHPNDKQAIELEGPGNYGKTEAWHVLDADPEAQIIAGIRPGTSHETLAGAIRNGKIVDVARYLPMHEGDTLLTRAGTVHALGPGLLIYEAQQSSDITYRIFDWDRPQDGGRKLHIEQAIAVSDPGSRLEFEPAKPFADGECRDLTRCEYFNLQKLGARSRTVNMDTKGETFHAITCIGGKLILRGEGWSQSLDQYETALIPAALGEYEVHPETEYRALVASVE